MSTAVSAEGGAAGEAMEALSTAANRESDARLSWRGLPRGVQLYVGAVMLGGACAIALSFPRSIPQPALFGALLMTSCVMSIWKVNLPIPLTSGATLSVSYAADLMALLLLGADQAVIVAVAGVWAQCTFKTKKKYPPHRTAFSMAGEALTMTATGAVYFALGGSLVHGDWSNLARPLVGAIATYFVLNTGLIAGAIAMTSDRTWWQVWRSDFLWSSASFMVAGTAGAAAAVVVARGDHWKAVLLLAPVYLTYRTYQVFIGRLEDQRRHMAETQRLHKETIDALLLARRAEQALADEKERLASTVAELMRLEHARKEALEREQAARAHAEEASRMKDQFLAMVSHELRTPLNAIVGWADMLRSGVLAEADRERACESIYANSRRQAHLIDELLDVARITTGKLRLERRAVDLRETVTQALEVVQAAADAKGLRVAVDLDRTTGTIYGDAGRLQQIVWNLLSNAVKFTPAGGAIDVSLRRVDGSAVLTVCDTGIGIASDFLPYVFEPFRQADATTTRRFGGLGLGLSIVKHLVEAHGGRISAESEGEDRGTTFTVRLPVVAPVAAQPGWTLPERLVQHRGEASVPSLAGTRVLVVDDDGESRDVVAASLTSRQAVVRTAESAAEAFEVLKHEPIDVVIADIGMPGEDGLTFIRKLRATNSRAASVPAAALTAFVRDEDRQEALRAGYQLHLAKPIDSIALVAAVASLGKLGSGAPGSTSDAHLH